MSNRGVNPWLHLVRAARYSLLGLRAAWRHEEAFRQEILVLVAVIPLGWWLGQTGLERLILIGSWWLVLVVELLNSAIEAAVDHAGSERNALAGRAKDLGSAAVFCTLLLAVSAWVLILGGH
jgi:diacylglycerol kinase (ATP)